MPKHLYRYVAIAFLFLGVLRFLFGSGVMK